MEAVFLKLVNMSITASWLVLAIIAVRLIFKKTPKWILCLLWGLVAIRLICPFSIESNLSLIPDTEPLSQETAYTSEILKQAHGEIMDSEGNVIVERNPAANGDILDSDGNVIVERNDGITTYPEKSQTHIWMQYLSVIWLVGFGVMLAYTAVSYYLLKKKVATAIPVKRGIKQSEYVDSPFVLGVIRPVIYLPFNMAEGDMSYVIAHERAHIYRRDHWWKPLGFLLLSIYWFNPLLWVAYILLCRDIEAACDEKVIREMDQDGRRAYSTALLNCSIHRRRIAACPLAFGEVGVKARVKGVMNYKKPAFWFILICLVLVLIVSVCFLTNPKSALPITMRADYVSRAGADLKFFYDDSLAEGEYQISEAYVLEVLEQGNWHEMENLSDMQTSEQVIEVQSDDADFDAWSLLNWEENYGRLPDGTFRIRKDITIYNDSDDPETQTVYVEFTIGGTADDYVTYTLEDITPTGAILYEHEKVADSTQLVYDGSEGFCLEVWQDGQWTYAEPTQYIEPILRKDRHYINQLIYSSDYIQLDWSALYGELPDGTYRIAREVTNTKESDLRVCTAYVEFTIGGEESPVTISLENVRPTGATILFHQNQDLIEGQLLCSREFFLQEKINGLWEDLPAAEGTAFPDQTYDISTLHHHGVDWEQMYGKLEVGSYRLGKVIPITSGENPEYTTVYAEFTIDNVYTWFDLYSTNADECHPKDNVVDMFGLDGASLSYDAAENEIRLVTADGMEPIISCEVIIRNAFLTDLSEDGVSEVCATIQQEDGMYVQVYDAAAKKLYELPTSENGYYLLTKKADRLCVLQNDANVFTTDYGQLAFTSDTSGKKSLEICELASAVKALTEQTVCVDIWTRKHTCLSSVSQMERALSLLRDLEEKVQPASREELSAAQKDSFNQSFITINYELGERTICFSEDFRIVWEYGSDIGYRISDPQPIRQFVQDATDGVRGKETAGEPFATVDTPWDWCANLNSSAVSTAEVYVCLDVTSYGVTSSVSSSSGILPAETLQDLITVLNQIPKDAFTADRNIASQTYQSFQLNQQEGNSSVSIIDGVNNLAVIIRMYKGNVEMLLTDELDKVQHYENKYLEPTQVWVVRDQTLRSFLEEIVENPPVITYSVGAEYEWQDEMEFSSGDFSLKMRLIEGWESERVSNSTNSGIRCRPEGTTEGWIYFSFWPEGYTVQEEDRYYGEGQWMSFPTISSYPSSVKTKTGVDTRQQIWSYYAVQTDIGDFVIINEGADSWFLEYEDQISDVITLTDFTTG